MCVRGGGGGGGRWVLCVSVCHVCGVCVCGSVCMLVHW